jgi:hypothetical protein
VAFWGEGRPLEHSEFRLASAFGFGGLTRASQGRSRSSARVARAIFLACHDTRRARSLSGGARCVP